MKTFFQKKIVFAFSIVFVSVLISTLAFSFLTQTDSDVWYKEAFANSYKIYSPVLPDTTYFAGERVPMDLFHVKERLDRELLVNVYWQSNTLLMLKRSNRWFPTIDSILTANNIPTDFKYLALIESAFLLNKSSAGAVGFWQFLEPTAKHYKLEVNNFVDERMHVEKATQAACNYLNNAYKRFGSWTIAAASFNTGETNISYHLRTQGEVDYYNMHLPDETMRYVFRIIAMKMICENPTTYGFYLRTEDKYAPWKCRTVMVDTTITNLFYFAKAQNVSYQTLKMYNPWLKGNQLPNKSRKKYTLIFPE